MSFTQESIQSIDLEKEKISYKSAKELEIHWDCEAIKAYEYYVFCCDQSSKFRVQAYMSTFNN